MISKEAFASTLNKVYPRERKYRFAEVFRSLPGTWTDVPGCRHCCSPPPLPSPPTLKRHDDGGGGSHTAPPDAGWEGVLIGPSLRSRRRRRGRRAKGWRNRQAPSRGPAATVSSRRASSQRPAAVPTRRKDGHDGWHGRPRAQSRRRVLPPAREEQAAVQRAARPAAIRTQAVAGLLRADL